MPSNQKLLIEIGQGLSLVIGDARLVAWTTNQRPKNPKTGTIGLNSQTDSLEIWNGESWLGAPLTEG